MMAAMTTMKLAMIMLKAAMTFKILDELIVKAAMVEDMKTM